MNDRTVRPPRSTRLLRGLVLFLAFVAIAWTVFWFSAASWAETQFEERTEALALEGRADIACGRHGVQGFPFAFRFVCDEDVMVETDRADMAFSAFDARTSVFSPSTLDASLKGPANLAVAPGTTIRADWTRAEAQASDLFDRRRGNVEFDALALDLPRARVEAAGLSAALAPEGAHLLLNVAGRDVTVSPRGRAEARLPRVTADIRLEGLHQRLIQLGRPFDRRNGLKGTVLRLGFDTEGEGRAQVSGPFEVSPQGRLSGRFSIAVRDADAVAQLATSFTDDAQAIAGALTALGALGRREEVDGVEMRVLELEAVDGRLPLGFFTLDLPPVWELPPGG